ncbi:MAG: hypothetical protein KFB93_01480 [Simkaniaceae bacterium]|nr:MAG: hypothetical protein KFB93_01480 [Simkaniaceae bacterium]
MSKFRITIASLQDREELVAEVIYDHCHWVEISAEKPNEFIIQFYPHPKKDHWEFSFDEAIEALQDAKNRLSKMQRTPKQQKEYDRWKRSLDES